MTPTEFAVRKDFFTNQLGVRQVKIDEGFKWGFIQDLQDSLKLKKAFIYLNTLSRYSPESSNSITEQQAEAIFTQLGKLLTA